MSRPKVSVILPTMWGKNTVLDLTRCFRSLTMVEYPLADWEIICVEDPSDDGTTWPLIEWEWLPRVGQDLPKITNIRNDRRRGFSGVNDIGLEAARKSGAQYVYLLNQDTDVDSLFLERAVARAEADPQVGLVQSLLLMGQDRDRVNSAGNALHFLGYSYAGGYLWTRERAERHFADERERGNTDLAIPTASGAGLLVRVAMTETTGLFDFDFFLYHEDVDLSQAARLAGWKVVIEPESVVYHHYEFSRSITKFYWMERNRLLVLLSYPKIATLVLLAGPILLTELLSLPMAVFGGGWHREKLRAMREFLKASTWRWIARRRRRIQGFRRLTDREFMRPMVAVIDFQEPGMNGWFTMKVANPLMTLAWRVIYFLIRW